MKSHFVISAPAATMATESGARAAIAELHSIVKGDTRLFPKGHRPKYRSQQLRGEKAMPAETFDEFLQRIERRYTREAVRRVMNRWLAEFGMCAADLAGAAASPANPHEELFDANVAVARFTTLVVDAGVDGSYDEREKRSASAAADQAVAEIRETERAVTR
jgi:hypothetical protein